MQQNNSGFDTEDLLRACLSAMSEDQIYRMAIDEGFVEVEHKGIDYDRSTPDRIIDAVLAETCENDC